jgi:hypothetical protein
VVPSSCPGTQNVLSISALGVSHSSVAGQCHPLEGRPRPGSKSQLLAMSWGHLRPLLAATAQVRVKQLPWRGLLSFSWKEIYALQEDCGSPWCSPHTAPYSCWLNTQRTIAYAFRFQVTQCSQLRSPHQIFLTFSLSLVRLDQ